MTSKRNKLRRPATRPYRVEALEKFVVRTVYFVTAPNKHAAERLCKAGEIAYDESSIEEGNEEWLATLSIRAVSNKETFPC